MISLHTGLFAPFRNVDTCHALASTRGTTTGSYTKGFTLIEVLLSVSLVALIAGLAAPVLFSLPGRTDFDAAGMNVVNTIRRAELLARGGTLDTPWGVRIETSRVVLFSGPNFASRDQSRDEEIIFPNGVVAAGLNEVVFSKLRGEPSATGTILLTSPAGKLANISVNSKGLVQYTFEN